MKINKEKGITLVALVITIVIMLILAGVTVSMFIGENGILNRAKEAKQKTEISVREEQLEVLEAEETLEKNSKYLTQPIGSIDFVQPWLFNSYTENDMRQYVESIRQAGFDAIIIQNIMEIVGGEGNTEVRIKNLWYDSNLQDTSEIEFYKPEILDMLVKIVSEKKMKIYIGLATSNDWWTNKFEGSSWRIKNIEFTNRIIDEIYNKYGKVECFAGIYYTNEMYQNTEGYEIEWSEMLNGMIQHIDSIVIEKNGGKQINILMSPFLSEIYDMNKEQVKQQWSNLIEKTNFRDGDIICLQDGLGTSNFSVEKIKEMIQATREAVKENTKVNMEFWIDVETYIKDTTIPAHPRRLISQLKISALYAEKLVMFSYSHYYNPQVNNGKSIEYNELYKKYYKEVTGKEIYNIEAPIGGSVYKDKNGDVAPIPKDFTVSETENVVRYGLVIKDNYGNEFVWVPVNEGIKPKGYEYAADEYKLIYYTRYLNNGISSSSVNNDTVPNNIENDEDQINKYKGFYVGRYECTFDYNNGNSRPMVKQTIDYKATENFYWQYADSDIYTGYMWNNINYEDAKKVSEKMGILYNYDSTVSTGLINGTQWDTILKWIHSCDETFSKINNGTTWGNYLDSVSPATDGNYEKGKLKATGSNQNWKSNNIFDIAGNLKEWTSEKNESNEHTIRSNSYKDNGIYGSPSYGMCSDSYQMGDTGFRIVLYIE